MNCNFCGDWLPKGTGICPHCGTRQNLSYGGEVSSAVGEAAGNALGAAIVAIIVIVVLLAILPVAILNPLTIYLLLIRGKRFPSIGTRGRKLIFQGSIIYTAWLIIIFSLGLVFPNLFYPNIGKPFVIINLLIIGAVFLAFIIENIRGNLSQKRIGRAIWRSVVIVALFCCATFSSALIMAYNTSNAPTIIQNKQNAAENKILQQKQDKYASEIASSKFTNNQIKSQLEKLGYLSGDNTKATFSSPVYGASKLGGFFNIYPIGVHRYPMIYIIQITSDSDSGYSGIGHFEGTDGSLQIKSLSEFNKANHLNLKVGDWYMTKEPTPDEHGTPQELTSLSQIPNF
ncbi:hypothetical protein GHI93_04585 [Lactococcus hircilactis]|uniref:Uncharacterized protein n=1 Tax=Lactococcus hircilactis TaxID=1494462 RepID=A0A7X2D0A6_9LACT|nr:hypothetical protein [Lactococcus hircilactis]MQW39216.1 hypothetical protein [Lactococcus hircilactis]